MLAPTFAHCVWPLPPEGAGAPAAWQSQFRGPCLKKRQEESGRKKYSFKQGPWNRLCRAIGAPALSGGRELHEVNERGGHPHA